MSHPHSPDCLHFIERCRIHFGLPVIIDVDDLVSDLPIDHPDHASFAGNRFNQILQSANYVVFSTPFFEMYCGHMNKHHSVIENSINKRLIKRIAPEYKPYKNCFTVGWTGGQSHRSDQYYTFLDGLREFLRKHDDAKAYFHVLCPEVLVREFGSQVIFEKNVVDYMDYPAIAAAYPMDVCLVGLTDTPFNNCKSDMKLLELAPHGIPLIASPRQDFIKHKDKALMLYADDDNKEYPSWFDQLEYAYNHQDRIKAMADDAYSYVMENRTSEIAAKKWQEVIEKVMSND
jgi:glycosyltransferase involved in cell wall biosynthesis